jgi:23S rRNA (pseudouridine1915-N3)-methyltransferase
VKIQVWAIGKNHDAYVSTGVSIFTNRIANYFPIDWQIIPSPKNAGLLPEREQRKKEAEAVLKILKKEDCLVVLDIDGISYSSEELALFIGGRSDEGIRSLIFLIGGAFGLDDTLLKRAQYKWSLSRLTFPHQLVRLILTEQIYRACSILRNEKYHHG